MLRLALRYRYLLGVARRSPVSNLSTRIMLIVARSLGSTREVGECSTVAAERALRVTGGEDG